MSARCHLIPLAWPMISMFRLFGLSRAEGFIHLLLNEPELWIARRLGDREKVFIDVGSCRGVFTTVCHRLFKRTVCFEPHERTVAQLRSMFREKADVVVIDVALGSVHSSETLSTPVIRGRERVGLSTLAALPKQGWLSFRAQAVQVRTLDSFGIVGVGLIKVDAEGYEDEIIQGARKTIRRDRPYLIVEVEQRHKETSIMATLRLISDLGYKIFFIRRRKLLPISKFRVEVDQNQDNMYTSQYINNFICIPYSTARQQ